MSCLHISPTKYASLWIKARALDSLCANILRVPDLQNAEVYQIVLGILQQPQVPNIPQPTQHQVYVPQPVTAPAVPPAQPPVQAQGYHQPYPLPPQNAIWPPPVGQVNQDIPPHLTMQTPLPLMKCFGCGDVSEIDYFWTPF